MANRPIQPGDFSEPIRPGAFNEPRRAAAASSAGPQAGAAANPAAPITDPASPAQLDPALEQDLWSGRASWKAFLPAFLGWVFLTAVAAGAVWFTTANPLYLGTVLAVLGALLLFLLFREAWQRWSRSYRLSTQRLFIRRGIFSQTVDQTELIRVDDVKIRQTLLQRILGIGDVDVLSSDRSDAAIVLAEIDNPEAVAEHIRRHTRTLQRRTVFMEQL